jgi:GTPase
MFNKIQL